MADSTLVKTIFVAAPRETVWAFLTDKNKLGEWFHPAESNLVLGEEYALVGKTDADTTAKQCWGTVEHMEPPVSLRYSFTVKPFAGAMTTVSWLLEDVHGGTKLTLRHEGISEAAGDARVALLLALDKGWDEHLNSLRVVLR